MIVKIINQFKQMADYGRKGGPVKKRGFDFGGLGIDDDELDIKSPVKEQMPSALRPARLPSTADTMA